MFGWCNGWCDLLMVNGEKGSKEIQPSQDEHVTTGDQKSLGINENPNAFGSVAATNKNNLSGARFVGALVLDWKGGRYDLERMGYISIRSYTRGFKAHLRKQFL